MAQSDITNPVNPSAARITIATFSGQKRKLSLSETFVISATAPSLAVLFTNPFDTAKVRLQLQYGAASRAGQEGAKSATNLLERTVYKGSFDCMRQTFKHEGVRGLQRGLGPAVLRESSKNMFRLGLYDPIMAMLHPDNSTSAPAWKRMVAGSLCGVAGAAASNPFELVKTRLQSAAPSALAVGHQHGYTGTFSGLASIYKNDGGISGLYKGTLLSMGRSIVGSGSNLASYSLTKEYFMSHYNWDDSPSLDMVAGLLSGAISCFFMNPIDVLRTRYYNQPIHARQSVGQVLMSLMKKEGPSALFKGLLPHFMRIGPHFCLTFTFLGILRRGILHAYDYRDLKESFKAVDSNGDGHINREDILTAVRTVIPRRYLNNTAEQYDKLVNEYADRLLATREPSADSEPRIKFADYAKFTTEFRRILHKEQLHTVFDTFDKKSDGKIDAQELKDALKDIHPRHPTMSIDIYEKMLDDVVQRMMTVGIPKGHIPGDNVGIDFQQFEKLCENVDSITNAKIVEKWAQVSGAKIM